MKILAIGNSFSQDATRYLQAVSESAGHPLFVRNLYIGGCSLERHANNITSDAKDYDYEIDAKGVRKVSINEGLAFEDWDWVTVQQVSGLSGQPETYEPYLSKVLDTVRAACPNAKIAFHRTWAYEIGSGHGDFGRYNKSQLEMFGSIVAASTEQAGKHGLPIIRSGDLVQVLRNTKPFDYKNGGVSLCRDGFHMSLDYGRFATALVWYKFFTGDKAVNVTYAPENTDPEALRIIKETADLIL